MITNDGLWDTLTIYDEHTVFRCMDCAAFVAREDLYRHEKWHKDLRAALTAIHDEVVRRTE